MEFGKKWIGTVATIDDDDHIVVDVAKLLRYLLLFDHVTVQSFRLREFEALVQAFGNAGLCTLLRSGSVSVYCHILQIGSLGQTDIGGGKPLPTGSYRFVSFKESQRKTYLHDCFQNVHAIDGLTFKEVKRLKHDIACRLVTPVGEVGSEMTAQLLSDIRGGAPQISTALAMVLNRDYPISIGADDLSLKFHEPNEGEFRVESNLASLTSLDELTRHKAVEQGLLAVGRLNQRIAEMNGYEALTDFWYRDLPVLGEKLSYLRHLQNPARREVFWRLAHGAGHITQA